MCGVVSLASFNNNENIAGLFLGVQTVGLFVHQMILIGDFSSKIMFSGLEKKFKDVPTKSWLLNNKRIPRPW